MKNVFIGPLSHWLIILALCLLGWLGGLAKLHVTSFNTFLVLLIAVSIGALVAVIVSSAPHKRITRDPIQDEDGSHPA